MLRLRTGMVILLEMEQAIDVIIFGSSTLLQNMKLW